MVNGPDGARADEHGVESSDHLVRPILLISELYHRLSALRVWRAVGSMRALLYVYLE
jgi:hypothetical protein